MGGRRSDRCIGAPSPRMDFRSRLREWRAAGTFSGNILGGNDVVVVFFE